MRIATIVCCFVVLISVIPIRAAEPKDFPVDPVAMIAGTEAAGKDEFSVVRSPYRYKFVDANNKAAFEKDPEKYEVQFGGACARMGPINSGGLTEFYCVHDGKLYTFASEACRKTFLKNPDAFLETDDPLPEVTEATSRRGRELLDLAIKAAGGADKIDGIKTCSAKVFAAPNHDESWGGMFISFPSSFCDMSKRGDMWWSTTIVGNAGWFGSPDRIDMMVASQHHAFVRELSRMPVVIFRARSQPDFRCAYIGPNECNGEKVEEIVVAFNGATTTLRLDPITGELRGAAYKGRGPESFIGDMQIAFTDPKTFDGITLPVTRTVTFNGEPAAEMSGTMDEIQINPAIDAKLFEVPKDK